MLKYIGKMLCSSMATSIKIIICSLLFVFSSQVSAQTAPAATSDEQMKQGMLQEVDYFANTFLDWVILNYATYSGEIDRKSVV